MPLLTEFKIQNPHNIPVRRMNNISRQAMHSVGIKWITDFNRPHYLPGAASKYGYQKRKEKYTRRKRRQYGHTTPLVWSGTTKAAALGPLFPRSTPKRTRANIPAPGYVKIRSRRGRPPVGDEMTRTIPAENDALSRLYKDSMEEQISAYIEGRKK